MTCNTTGQLLKKTTYNNRWVNSVMNSFRLLQLALDFKIVPLYEYKTSSERIATTWPIILLHLCLVKHSITLWLKTSIYYYLRCLCPLDVVGGSHGELLQAVTVRWWLGLQATRSSTWLLTHMTGVFPFILKISLACSQEKLYCG